MAEGSLGGVSVLLLLERVGAGPCSAAHPHSTCPTSAAMLGILPDVHAGSATTPPARRRCGGTI